MARYLIILRLMIWEIYSLWSPMPLAYTHSSEIEIKWLCRMDFIKMDPSSLSRHRTSVKITYPANLYYLVGQWLVLLAISDLFMMVTFPA